MQTELQNLVNSYLVSNPGGEKELARQFGVSRPTVQRWANGIARPHPRIAQLIIDYLKSKSQTG